jgi:hypothetical protein
MSAEGVSARPRQRLQDELVPRKQARQSDRNEKKDFVDSESKRSERGRRRGRGRDRQDQPSTPPSSPPAPPATAPGTGTTAPVTTQPVGPATPVPSSDARTLAERYVAQFEEQSGNQLSAEERTAKVNEVADFYDSPSRTGRLNKIVFA